MTSAVGRRPAPLSEVAGPQGMVRPACPCTTVPSLALAELGCGSDAVDSSAFVFLVCRALKNRKEEEEKVKEEARMERIEDMICEGAPVSAADMAAWRRWATKDRPSSSISKKRKKRRRRRTKKKLPRSGPLLCAGALHHRGRAHRLSLGHGGLVCACVLHRMYNCAQLLLHSPFVSCCSFLVMGTASSRPSYLAVNCTVSGLAWNAALWFLPREDLRKKFPYPVHCL